MGQTTDELCERVDWDSDFFGIPIGRVRAAMLAASDGPIIDRWCADHRIECLYFLCDVNCPNSSRLAEDWGFRLVDIRHTLSLPRAIASPADEQGVRPARPDDLDQLVPIARNGHTDSRYYHDPGFRREQCDALYERWIRASVEGWAKTVLVIEEEGKAAGYITCHLTDANAGSIGLIGVADASQGRGVGRRLTSAAVKWFRDHHADPITVVTQGRNTRAQRLYQRAGFVTERVKLWFHRWTHQGTRG